MIGPIGKAVMFRHPNGESHPRRRHIASTFQNTVTAAQIESVLALGQNPEIQFDNPVCDAPLLHDIDLLRCRFGARIELSVLWP